jgi:hypothetical protein
LPADFEVFGQAVDTSLADLKGGTTDQVLAKNSNTDMDFKWVTSDDANAIQNSIVDAKGDLIAASANDTPARLAVGNNGETLVADSSTSTGLRYQGSSAAGRNFIINGGMDVWQRGTSIAIAAAAKTFASDRFWAARGGSVAGSTVSRQATGDTTNLPFIQYCARVQRDSGNTSTQFISFNQDIETVNSIPLAGRTVTLSFYARAGANFSATSSALPVSIVTGTGTDQSLSSGYTGQVTAFSGTATLTTTWQRFTFTGSIGATATQIGIQPYYVPVGTAGANDYFEITGIQLEVGSVATQFSRAAATIQGELAACQRYYQRFDFDTDGLTGFFGNAYSTTAAALIRDLAVPLRTTQTTVDYSNFRLYDFVNGYTITSLVGWSSAENHTAAVLATGASGLTQYRVYYGANNGSAGYIAIGAEL